MKNESVIEYLERHIFEFINERECLSEFINYDLMSKNIEDIFDIAKKYHKYQTIEILKYVINIEDENGKIRSKDDFHDFAEKLFNKFFNQ